MPLRFLLRHGARLRLLLRGEELFNAQLRVVADLHGELLDGGVALAEAGVCGIVEALSFVQLGIKAFGGWNGDAAIRLVARLLFRARFRVQLALARGKALQPRRDVLAPRLHIARRPTADEDGELLHRAVRVAVFGIGIRIYAV